MSGTHPDDFKEEIRRRIDIASLIGEYVILKKAGRNLLGLCPFHHEKTPSFTVSPEKQMFFCYGCSEGGDVFSFLMKLNNVTFPEALRDLAKRAGVVIPQRQLSYEEREQGLLRERIRQANELAAGFLPAFSRRLSGRRRGTICGSGGSGRMPFRPSGWDLPLMNGSG